MMVHLLYHFISPHPEQCTDNTNTNSDMINPPHHSESKKRGHLNKSSRITQLASKHRQINNKLTTVQTQPHHYGDYDYSILLAEEDDVVYNKQSEVEKVGNLIFHGEHCTIYSNL